MASSDDLIKWTQYASDNQPQKLYGTSDFRSVIAQASAFAGTNGGINSTWAPDVEYLDGKYYMYFSLTSAFGSGKSVIGRVEADSVTGPYSNEKIIVKSNNEANAPNAIDPELFFDAEGRLWMVYGSFFGGIYVKELYNSGENIGLPKEEGFGKLLWRGGFSSGVEGPFIFYDEGTEYYYLMVSEGDLMTSYNMRVARSKNPDGPYVDITGADVASSGTGNKLAGNYEFASDGSGFGALGHNSVIRVDGKWLCVYHTRYEENNGVSGRHNVQVNQIFLNEEGWPVLSPNRYAGESACKIKAEEVVGTYELVEHAVATDATFTPSSLYAFRADGKIYSDGFEAGTWTLSGENYLSATVNGTQYQGVVVPAWKTSLGKEVLSITATSSSGRALWANRTLDVTEGEELNFSAEIFAAGKGTVSNRTVGAFDAQDGFSVTFKIRYVTSDWDSIVITAGSFAITLPNLDAWWDEGRFAQSNCYPDRTDDRLNGNNWDTFLNTTCTVTISVSPTDGITFYKDGVAAIRYLPTRDLSQSKNGLTVGDFIEELLIRVGESGFVFAGGITATDMYVTEVLTQDQIGEILQIVG